MTRCYDIVYRMKSGGQFGTRALRQNRLRRISHDDYGETIASAQLNKLPRMVDGQWIEVAHEHGEFVCPFQRRSYFIRRKNLLSCVQPLI